MVFYPKNHGAYFMIELPKTLELTGEWEVAVLEYKWHGSVSGVFYIFSDLCTETYMRDSMLPLLRSILVDKSESKEFREYRGMFSVPYYTPIRNNRIDRFRIWIQNETLNSPIINPSLYLTLHLRKK